jgi:hypothetical protein
VLGRYLDAVTFASCYLLAEIPDGKGINLLPAVAAKPQVRLCQIPNCAKCASDSAKCADCNSPRYLDTTDYLNCYLDADIPTFKGKWLVGVPAPATLAIRACQVTDCKVCKNNSLLCEGCKDAPGDDFYLDESTNNACVTYANIPTLKGIVPMTTPKKINVCTVSNCLLCKDNRTQCTQCQFSGTPYWLDLTVANTCLAQAAIDPLTGRGKVPGAAILSVNTCAISNCSKCNENNTQCTECSVGYWLDSVTNTNCYLPQDIPAGKGRWIETPPLTILKVRACSAANCINCFTNSLQCFECASTYYLDLATNTSCYLYANIPLGKGVVFGNSPLAANTCTRANCELCTVNRDKCMRCTSSYFIDTTDDSMCIQVISTTNAKGIILGSTYPSAGFCNVNLCKNCWNNTLKCNECNSGIWLDITNNDACLVSIPDGKGEVVGATPLQARNCTVITAKCKSCLANSSICTECIASNYLDMVTRQHCYLFSEIPSFKGAVPSASNPTLQVNNCVSNCQLCAANNTLCAKCASTFFLDTRDNITCWPTNGFPASMGIKISEVSIPSIEPCIANCLTCTNNSLICNACAATYLLNNLTKTACYHENAIPNLLGEVLPTQSPRIVESCTIANCLVCPTNKNGCDGCTLTTHWLDLPAKLTCFNDASIPTTKGKVALSNPATVSACSSNCLFCKANNADCTNCDLANNWWINDGVCVHGTAIPVGKGKKLGTGRTENCTVANPGCLKCFEDSTKCIQCDQLNDYWLGGDLCYTTPNIPDGRGKEILTGFAPLCSVQNCWKCAANYQTCTDCLPSYSIVGNTCSLACTSPGCTACPVSFSVCTVCNKATDYWLENGACVLGTNIAQGKGRKDGDGTVALCSKEFCKVCQLNFSKCETCQDNYTLGNDSCTKVEPAPVESDSWKWYVAGGVTGGAILIGVAAYLLAKSAGGATVAALSTTGGGATAVQSVAAPQTSNRLESIDVKTKDGGAEAKASEQNNNKAPEENKNKPSEDREPSTDKKPDEEIPDSRKARFVSQGTKTFIKYL